MSKGMITCLISGEYTIFDFQKKINYKSKPRGLFRINGQQLKVGDVVDYSLKGDSYIITKLYPRKVDLVRPAIANIDQAFVIFSVKEPNLNLNLLDRFLVILEYSLIKPIIVFSKWDLLNTEEKKEIDKVYNYYLSIGYTVLKTSTKLNLIPQLENYINNHISVFTGQSGVGKSSLLNLLDTKLNLETNSISKALNRGKHTTRHIELLPINNGWIADTPGFGLLDFNHMTEKDIAHSFVEFLNVSRLCKYGSCLHLNEPNCEVKRLVENKEILLSRYENYQQFCEEIRKRKKW